MNCICVDALKQPTTKSHLRKKKVYCSLQVQRDGVHDVWEGTTAVRRSTVTGTGSWLITGSGEGGHKTLNVYSQCLPLTRLNLLKFPYPPQITAPAGDQVLNHQITEAISYWKHNLLVPKTHLGCQAGTVRQKCPTHWTISLVLKTFFFSFDLCQKAKEWSINIFITCHGGNAI